MTTTAVNAKASGTFTIGGDLVVNRLGYGAMRITGDGIWGEPKDRESAKKVLQRAVEARRFGQNGHRGGAGARICRHPPQPILRCMSKTAGGGRTQFELCDDVEPCAGQAQRRARRSRWCGAIPSM